MAVEAARRTVAVLALAGTVAAVSPGFSARDPQSPSDVDGKTLHTISITEFPNDPIPPRKTRFLNAIVAGYDGNLWFTEQESDLDTNQTVGRIGRITPSGTITKFPIASVHGTPGEITAGPGGNLYFTLGSGEIGRITPGGAIATFAVGGATDLVAGPDGNIWFTAGGEVGRLTASGDVSRFPVPIWATYLAAGPDGKLWYTHPVLDVTYNDPPRVGWITIDGVTGTCASCSAFDDYPFQITLGPDGNLWFTGFFWGRIVRINFDGEAVLGSTRWSVGQLAEPYGITGGPDGNIWFTEQGYNQIGRITPTGSIVEYAVPTPLAWPRGIAAGPDGNVWFVESETNIIGRINLQAGHRFTVNSTGDAGDRRPEDDLCATGVVLANGLLECTLRAAIDQANATAGRDTIAFSIPAADTPLIEPASPLPDVTDHVVLDASTQPVFHRIELSGRGLPWNTISPLVAGLTITAGDSVVRGFVIHDWRRFGLALSGNGSNRVEGNFIGTDATGRTVGGNGVNPLSMGQSLDYPTGGIWIHDSPGNTIGGWQPSARNIISGNYASWPVSQTSGEVWDNVPLTGVWIQGSASTGNVVQGNYIGPGVSGGPLVGLDDEPAWSQGDGVVIDNAPHNTIGGTTAATANVISGNSGNGIHITGAGSVGNVVQGNLIGPSADGSHGVANGHGVHLDEAPGNTIGGMTSDRRNVISGNRWGLYLEGSGTSGNVVQGNLIGVAPDGVTALGNASEGILFISGASGNTIGGTESGAGNVIAHSGDDYSLFPIAEGRGTGIFVGDDSHGNALLGNSIHDNRRLGIDLEPGGVNLVDAGGSANQGQDAPELSAAWRASSETLRIQGTAWNGSGANPHRLEFFVSSTCDPTGRGEGKAFVGYLPVSLSFGTATFDGTWTHVGGLPADIVAGRFVTATITDANGNSSEFSRCLPLQGATQSDSDAVSDEIEDAGPHGGDGNQDGIADSRQPDVASLPDIDGRFVTVVSEQQDALLDVSLSGLPDTAGPLAMDAAELPFGMLSFTLTSAGGGRSRLAGTRTVTLWLPEVSTVSSYFNYGPTPDDPTPHFYEFSFDGTTGAQIQGNRVTLHLVDGLRGDHDLVADGRIQTLGGLVDVGRVQLTLSAAGLGGGEVQGRPMESCRAGCTSSHGRWSQVRLEARPDATSALAGWSGDPDCIDGRVTMTESLTCTATFVPVPTGAPVDLDGDGGGDLFAYDAAGGGWFDARGNLGADVTYQSGTWSPGWHVLALELDGSPGTDFFLYNPASGGWYQVLSTPGAGFRYIQGRWSAGWRLFPFDLDGDGRSDLIVYHPDTGEWVTCRNVGGGAFTYRFGRWSPGWSIHPARLNRDAFDDLFLYDPDSGQWYRALGTGDGAFEYAAGAWSSGWSIVPGDFGDDDLTDVFLYNASTGQWYLAENDGASFAYRAGTWSPGWAIRAVDLNGDGVSDLFLYDTATGDWYEVFLHGDLSFTYAGGRWSPDWQVFVADMDGDGRGDVMLYNAMTGEWYQALNRGSGEFVYRRGTWDPALTLVTSQAGAP